MSNDMVRNMVRNRARRVVLIVLGVLVVMPLVIALFGGAVMLLWNWLMPALFGLKTITFAQGLGLLVLSWMLFGGHRGFQSTRHRSRGSWRDRWEAMTPEQRAELRRAMESRCGRAPSGASTASDVAD